MHGASLAGIVYSRRVCTGSAGIACARGYSVGFSDSTSVSQSNGVREYRSPVLSVGTERHAVWRGAGAYGAWIDIYGVDCSAAFAAISREMEQAACSIGAGPWRTFIDISLPQALPGLMAAAIFVFLE
ncbi:MAG: ABC transporter permease subunit [Symbiopectobacterium sp.]|uniref:ABC transporter permease subunit n=1 Tax=Symbiopectobacterium sp. TaxID=2952789 RepID=UPI003F387651